jgi:polyisoprenoid-binding protein YceI
MKNLLVGLVGAFALFSFVVSQAGVWSVDGAHSRLGFTILHNGITNVHGNFAKFTMEVSTPNADFTGATIVLNADAASVNTGIEARDNHLRTADCFDAEKHPSITFKSTSVTAAKANGTYIIEGELTMHGTTKKVIFNGVHTGNSKNYKGTEIAGLQISGTVKRSEFGMGEVSPGLADEVKLQADLEIAKN